MYSVNNDQELEYIMITNQILLINEN